MAKSSTPKGGDRSTALARAPAASSRSGSPSSASASSSSSASASSSSDSDNDSSSSSSGRSSASPEPQEHNKVERVIDPSLRKYTAPAGFQPLKATVDKGALDWDDLKDDADLELWAVRVPVGLKAKHLDGLTLTLPSADLATPAQPVGHLTAKKAEYDAYLSAPGAASSSSSSSGGKRKRDGEEDESSSAVEGMSELAAAVPLLPRKSHGNKLFQAPRPITRTLTLQRALPAAVLSNPTTAHLLKTSHSSLIASQPSPVPGAILDAAALLLSPAEIAQRKESLRGAKARDQPQELLQFRLTQLGGMGPEGGKGRYHNPMAAIVLRPEGNGAEGRADEEAEAEADVGRDVEMTDATEEAEAAKKAAKKARRKAEGAAAAGAAESPRKKKKRVQAEEEE